MVATVSTMQKLGIKAPEFNLADVRSKHALQLTDFEGKPLLLMFICNHCPFVIHIVDEMTEIANEYQRKGYAVIAISSNDAQSYPQDGPAAMEKFAVKHRFEFAYCYDESQDVAKSFGAACTPDFFVYDHAHRLRYRGQMDAARPANSVPPSGVDLQMALQAILDGIEVNPKQTASLGCNIKWKPEIILS
jgi:peroxiredoxin